MHASLNDDSDFSCQSQLHLSQGHKNVSKSIQCGHLSMKLESDTRREGCAKPKYQKVARPPLPRDICETKRKCPWDHSESMSELTHVSEHTAQFFSPLHTARWHQVCWPYSSLTCTSVQVLRSFFTSYSCLSPGCRSCTQWGFQRRVQERRKSWRKKRWKSEIPSAILSLLSGRYHLLYDSSHMGGRISQSISQLWVGFDFVLVRFVLKFWWPGFGRRIQAVFVKSWLWNCGFNLCSSFEPRHGVEQELKLKFNFSVVFSKAATTTGSNNHLWSEEVDNAVPHSLEKIKR